MRTRTAFRARSRSLPALAGLCALVLACGCVPRAAQELVLPDSKPPVLLSWEAAEDGSLRVTFDEAVSAAPGDFAFDPSLGAVEVAEGGSETVALRSAAAQEPGRAYLLTGAVRDAAGNLNSFSLPCWGRNPDLPRVLLNELLTEGGTTHPDALELAVLTDGDLAGLALCVGALPEPTLRYVFPPCAVKAGEFLVVHWKPQGLSTELDETGPRDEAGASAASGGLDATPGGRDFWYRGGDGALTGKNGAVTLYANPGGGLRDAALYSERASDSDEKYGGFGSAALRDWVKAVGEAGGWSAGGGTIRPEDCVRSGATTSTRTMCRDSRSSDSDAAADWHVVPTKGATLGGPNADEAYVPPAT